MLLKQEDFKYPTAEEILSIKDLIPDISSFNLKKDQYVSEILCR